MPVETHTCTLDEKICNSFGEAPVTISHLLNRKHIILHICIPLSHHYRRVVNLAVATLTTPQASRSAVTFAIAQTPTRPRHPPSCSRRCASLRASVVGYAAYGNRRRTARHLAPHRARRTLPDRTRRFLAAAGASSRRDLLGLEPLQPLVSRGQVAASPLRCWH